MHQIVRALAVSATFILAPACAAPSSEIDGDEDSIADIDDNDPDFLEELAKADTFRAPLTQDFIRLNGVPQLATFADESSTLTSYLSDTFELQGQTTVRVSTSEAAPTGDAQVDALNARVDTVLYVYRKDGRGLWGRYLHTNDNGAGGRMAALDLDLESGEYRIILLRRRMSGRFPRGYVPTVMVTTVRSAPTAAEAEAGWWDAINGTNYEASTDVVDALDLAYAEDPDNVRLVTVLAGAHLWRAAESSRLGATAGPVAAESGAAMHRWYMQGLTIAPTDPTLTETYGAILFQGAARIADPAQMEAQRTKGAMMIEAAVDAVPASALFARGQSYAYLPPTDERLADGEEDMWHLFAVCGGIELDRSAPDLAGYIAAEPTSTANHSKCYWSDRTPHNLEALFLLMGDLLVKRGKLDVAQMFYNGIELIPGAVDWPYRTLLEARLAVDLADRSATYQSNDPTIWAPVFSPGRPCAVCHSAAAP